jgi:hypothetical protein
MFNYDILCEVCKKVVGVVAFELPPSEEKQSHAVCGYICEDCAE